MMRAKLGLLGVLAVHRGMGAMRRELAVGVALLVLMAFNKVPF